MSTKVTKAAGLFFDAALSAPGSVGGADDSFSQIMNRTKQDFGENKTDIGQEKTAQAKTPVQVEKSSEKEAAWTKKTETKETAGQETAAADDPLKKQGAAGETVKEAVLAAAEEIAEAVKEELDLTDEELTALMETLGLAQMDLLRPEIMQQIVVAAAGDGDSLSILTDEALYASVQKLTDIVSETVDGLQEQLAMSKDGGALQELLRQMEVSNEPQILEEVQTEDADAFEVSYAQETSVLTEAKEEPEAVITVETAKEEPDEIPGKQNISENRTEEVPERTADTAAPEPKEVSKEPQKEAGRGSGQENNAFLHAQTKPGETFFDTEAVQAEAELPYEPADVQRIMNQITERIKVETGTELTEVEMQLQPETLGTLRIHLTSKEGAVTAQFTAENESVRAVLEAQTMQLKENLNQQGIKVEAVEVTIANQGFERSFAQNEQQSGKYEEPKKRGIRKIQLSDGLDISEMELSEEERLTAEMMEINGNTVDYMA